VTQDLRRGIGSTVARETNGKEMTEPGRRAWLWDLGLLFVFAAFGPVMAVVNNPEAPNPWTALVVAVVIFSVGLIARSVLIRLGLQGRGSTYAVAATVFLALNFGPFLDSFPRWIAVALILIAAVLTYRLRHLRLFEYLVSWAGLGLALWPVVVVSGLLLGGQQSAQIGQQEAIPVFVSKPDVVLVVVDGYASGEVLEEFFDYDNSPTAGELAMSETFVNPHMTSNYARTKFSVASFLELGYIPEGTRITRGFESDLIRIIGGENRLTRAMKANGYRTVYLESGWTGTRCGESIDVCVPGPWPDETFYDIVYRSVFRDLPGLETGISFSRGAEHSMRGLDNRLEGYFSNQISDFVYVHLLAPHPPFFLSADCEMQPDRELSGFALVMPDMASAQADLRRAAYLDQIECVNRHLTEAARQIADSGAVGMFMGDHGSDLGLQLFTHADAWTDEQRRERLGVFFAVHHVDCDYQAVTSLVNATRRMLSCLTMADFAPLPDRYFDLDKHLETPEIVEIQSPNGDGA
jgi:Sulfatase